MDKENNKDKNIDIDKEIKELTKEFELSDKKEKEEIVYRLIYLYKKKENHQQEKNYIEFCLKKDIILSEEIWLDYIKIKKQENKMNYDEIINIYLKSLEDFIYPKIIYEFFNYILDNEKIMNYTKCDIYFNKYIIKGLFSPEYSIKIFDLFYKFNKLLYGEIKIEEKNLKEYIKNKLNKECFLLKNEIEQIFIQYNEYKISKTEKLFFIFDNQDDEEEEEKEDIQQNIIFKMNEFNIQYNLLFNESFEDSNLIIDHLESNINLLLKVNEKYIIYYYEKTLSKYVNNHELWSKYLYILDNINNNQISKLEKIKLACKCCKKSGKFIVEYLSCLEKNNVKDLPNIINNILNDENYNKKIEDIYEYYLQYKIRNTKDINNNEIKLIRELFQKCLSSIQNYNINEFTAKILHMWTEFEVYKTKDKNMFFNLMKKICLNLDKSINSFRAFIYYAKSFPNNELQIR